MSCVRESSPQSDHVVSQRPEPKVRRFNPLRRLRQIFKRKAHSPEPHEVKSCDNTVEPSSLDTSRSRSTSQLIDEPFTRRRSLHSTILSVSHDSVFNPEQHSGQSDSESAVSVPRLGFPQANIQAELLEAVRRRRKIQDDDDSFDNEDLGLPRSPSMHSPTIATGNDLRLSKELITKSSHSTCSDGSLLSMGSSEMDEDSFGAHNSRHSSKISLHDKRASQTHLDSSDGDYSTSVPLSHDVAKHRMAIRPKRKHGNPRSKKPLAVTNALPATPEVNEEHSGRSTSPETKPQTADTAGIYNYGQSYSAYYPSKFSAKRPSKNNAFAKPKRKIPNRRCRAFRLCGCLSRSRSGAYRVRNDTLPYFVRSSSVRPVGFNKISPPLSVRKQRQSLPRRRPPPPQQQRPKQIDVTQGRIRLNLYAYPEGYLAFLESYFVCTSTSSGSSCGTSSSNVCGEDDAMSKRKRLSAISEEDVCPLCGGSVDYATMKTATTSRWKNALLVPF